MARTLGYLDDSTDSIQKNPSTADLS